MTKQEAIDVLQNTIVRFGRSSGKTVYSEALNMAIEALESQERQELIVGSYLIEEPSCSEKPNMSEPLTDKEQRIFLAAMGRERKICKEIDDEWFDSQNPHVVDSLVSICNEIERKVKSELWNVK